MKYSTHLHKVLQKSAIVSILLVVLSFVLNSPFQKGGVDQDYPLYYSITAFAIAVLYLYDTKVLTKAEIIVFSGLISVISVIAAFYSTHFLLNCLLGFDYQVKISMSYFNTFLANIIVLMIPNLLMILAAYAILKYKQ